MNPDDNDAWELAHLAAQIGGPPGKAIDTAWELVKAARLKFEAIRLQEGQSPEAKAAWEEWEREKAENLANVHASFKQGIKWITSQTRLDRARESFKDFLLYNAKARGETTSARADALLVMYRNRGFTGAEARKLKAEWEQWNGKGRQGRLKKPATDGRLRENKQKALARKGKAAMSELTKEKPEWRTKHYRQSALKGARGKGKQGRDYQDPSNPENDTPGNTLGGKTLEDDPALQAALNDPAPA